MQLSDKIKKFSVEQAIDYLNRNPVKNLPKLLDWADTFCAGKFEGQRRAISSEAYFRQLIDEAFADEMLRVKNFIPAISLEGDETTTDSRRSEKEVKRAQRTQKNCVQRTQKHRLPVGRRCFFRLPLEGKARAHSPAQGKASSALPVLRRVTAKRKTCMEGFFLSLIHI